MGDKIHTASQKTAMNPLKPKTSQLRQRRYGDSTQPEISSNPDEERASSLEPSTQASSPLTPSPPGHNFGRMGIWPATSLSIQPKRANGQLNLQSEQITISPMARSVQSAVPAALIQRQQSLDDPARYDTIHQNLFVMAPGSGSQPIQTWQATTEAQIIRQFKQHVQQEIDQNPRRIIGQVRVRTTEADAERDALTANQRIASHFPQISSQISASQVRTAVEVMPSGQTPDQTFMEQWLANQLVGHTEIGNFGVNESDPRFQSVVTGLLNDATTFNMAAAYRVLRQQLTDEGWEQHDIDAVVAQERQRIGNPTWSNILQIQASRQAAFSERGQRIALNQGIGAAQRLFTLLHEFVHFYAHDQYKNWVQATTSARFFDEGFTEFLARQILTPQEISQRQTQSNNYQERVAAIEAQVLPFATSEDIAAAYFRGEVWRLEHQSQAAGQAFGAQIGIQPGATPAEEANQSRTSPGFNQTVSANQHYRFMNLANDAASPKPEHRTFFQTLFSTVIQLNPSLQIRFVGHASATGAAAHNRALSRRRVNAFYSMARDVGVLPSQLINASQPEFEGESSATAGNDTPIGRAMNRRVELFIIDPSSTRLEDNVFRLGRLRGVGVDPNDMSMSRNLGDVRRNAPDATQALPFTTSGWDANRILTRLGQYDLMGGTDSDAARCVQAVALTSYIVDGPDAVRHYLDLITQEARRTRRMNDRRRTALEVIRFVQNKIANQTASFGDLSWVQEAVHDLFFDDVSGTPEGEIRNQITPPSDAGRRSQSLNIWTSSPAELSAEVQRLQPGEQLIVENWNVLFNETYHQLRDRGVAVSSPMQVDVNGRRVTISEISAAQRPNPQAIDLNRDKKHGHQLLIFMDNSARTWLYEPEIHARGQHLFELTAATDILNGYYRELPNIESYEYVQIIGRVTPVALPTTGHTP